MGSKRALLAGTALLALLAAVFSLCAGAVTVPPGELLAALTGQGEGTSAAIILYVRLPRTAGCLAAGASLAVSGAVIQTVLANPLASPNVIGGQRRGRGGGGTVLRAGPYGGGADPHRRLCGGVRQRLAGAGGVPSGRGASRMTLILTGVGPVQHLFGGGGPGGHAGARRPQRLLGFPGGRAGQCHHGPGGPRRRLWGRCAGRVLLLTNELDVLALGSETARSLGLRVGRMRVILLALAAGLAGAAVSVAGLISYVGLIVPHLIRRFLGEESRPLVIGCAFGGAALLTVCDTAARTLFAPTRSRWGWL